MAEKKKINSKSNLRKKRDQESSNYFYFNENGQHNKENVFESDNRKKNKILQNHYPLNGVLSKNLYLRSIMLKNETRKPLQDISKSIKGITFGRNADVISQIAYEELENKKNPIQSQKNYITTERNYDFLDMKNLTIEYKSDESFFFEEDFENNLKPSNSLTICTPANSFFPKNHMKAIKQIRKINSKYSESNFESGEISNINKLSIKKYDQLENEEATFSNEININHDCTSLYKIPGVVNLDPDENFVIHSILYSRKYLKTIMQHQLIKEINYKLSELFLNKFTITNMNRSIVINWMIKLQAYMKIEHIVVYTAVRIMDKALDNLDIPLNMLQLVALASFWISLKFHAVNHKEVSWMVKQSDGAYTNHQLIMMERRVFQANNFDINSVDLSIYVHYYILYLQLEHSDRIAQCSHYIMDCALLDCRFVRILPSKMAAASVFTSLYLLNRNENKSWKKLENYKGYYHSSELMSIMDSLIEMLKEVNNPKFQCREPFYKFLNRRYLRISEVIKNRLVQC